MFSRLAKNSKKVAENEIRDCKYITNIFDEGNLGTLSRLTYQSIALI
jgi:hypothetical protein